VTVERQALGRKGEAEARAYLRRRGIRILAENFACPAGEIDLIGSAADQLLFIEVKTRRSAAFGPPQSAVHHRKQQQIVNAAQWYLAAHRTAEVACRFDVVTVTFASAADPPRIEWVQDAFPAEGVRVW
jgi:putative endonuclease